MHTCVHTCLTAGNHTRVLTTKCSRVHKYAFFCQTKVSKGAKKKLLSFVKMLFFFCCSLFLKFVFLFFVTSFQSISNGAFHEFPGHTHSASLYISLIGSNICKKIHCTCTHVHSYTLKL